MKVLVMTYFSKASLEVCLGMLSGACNIEDDDVIIASLNAGDEVEKYLISQSRYRYVIAEENDSYGMVMNIIMSEFLEGEENLAVINEGMSCFPDAFELAEKYISTRNAGAIVFDRYTSLDGEYTELQKKHKKKDELYTVVGCEEEGFVLSGKLISENGMFDENYFNTTNAVVDYFFSGGQKGFSFYKSSDCMVYAFCNMPINKQAYLSEKALIRDKWGMNYFTFKPNQILMDIIPVSYSGEVNVLEVGCDCGGNGSGIRELYPECHLYGLELNPNSAKIAATIYDEVIVGNAEEMELPFGDVSFDIVVFGDVLEHLRDPLGMLRKCYSRMNDGGVVVTSIPNLMHFSVMRQLINGHFQYENDGLLDRTHIHLFTYYEIVKMFKEAEFKIEDILTTVLGKMSEEDEKMVKNLVSMSNMTNREMYEAFQYNVRAVK